MSAGWAWQCDGCGETEMTHWDDRLDRPNRSVPVGWSITNRLVSSSEGVDVVDKKYFCDICSDGRNL